MSTKMFLIAVVIVAAFGIAAMVGPATIATQAVAQNTTGDNATMMAGNYIADNNTGGNWTK
jgi:hypothetical protein